eukprot:gene4574-14754_t
MQGRAICGRPQVNPAAKRPAAKRVASSKKTRSARRTPGRSQRLVVRAGPVEIDEDDLLQIPDRIKWYESKFAADDMPDWYPGRFVSSKQVAPGLKSIVLELEAGREKVPLRNAYKNVGQRAMVRINSGIEAELSISSSPHGQSINHNSLMRLRGDLFAGEIKVAKPEPGSVLAEVELLVSKEDCPDLFAAEVELLVSKEDCPDLYVADTDDMVEVGPFKGSGLDLKRSPLNAIFRYPTIVMFVSGKGIGTARALVYASADVPSLCIGFRQDVRIYYKAPNEASLCYKEEFEEWEARGVKVATTTSESFFDAFDDDDTLRYDPETTGAIILTGKNVEDEKLAREACQEAEITEILSDMTEPDVLVEHLDSVPTSFTRWIKE